jgi:exonuclease SbcC
MKIQKLTIHNIASIEDAVIDFESTSLSSSELFLITGKTGSGKSTILDAICLALYASTPRLESTRMQGSVKDLDQDVSVADPRQLLRNGKGEGYVILEFIGTNKIPYRAEWGVRRAHGKPNGRLQSKDWSLTDLSTNISYKKDSEIKSLMADAIGLNFEQFCRTTMLAQGEFTRFLNSEDKDKAAILEKITGVSIYSEIGVAIYNITCDKEKELGKLKERCEEIVIPSAEEIEALKETVRNAQEEHKALEARSKAIAGKLTWLEQYSAVLARISAAEQDVQEANQKAESPEYIEESRTVADWNASAQARESYIALSELTDEKIRLENLIEDQKKRYQSLLSAAEWEKDQLQTLADTLDSLQRELDTVAVHSKVYLNEQTISARLKAIENALSKISAEETGLKVAEDKRKKLAANKHLLESGYMGAESKFKAAEQSLKNAIEVLKKFNLPAYRARLEELNARKAQLSDASGCLRIYNRTLEAFNDAVSLKSDIEKKISSLDAESVSLSEKLNEAEIARKTAEDIRKKLERSVDEWAKSVRATLSVDDECPVCRRKVESLPAEDVVEEVYAVANQAYEDAKASLDQIQAEYNKVSADHKAFKGQLNTAEATLGRLKVNLESDMRKLADALKKVEIELTDETGKKIDDFIVETESVIAQNLVKIKEGEKLEKDVDQKRKDVDQARNAKDKALKDLNAEDLNLKSAEHAIVTRKTIIQELKNSYDDTVVELEGSIAGYDRIDIDWKTEPGRYSNELKHLTDKYNALREDVTTATQKKQRCKDDCDALLGVIAQIAQEMPEWGDLKAENKVSMEGAQQKANSVLAVSVTTKDQLSRNDAEIRNREDDIKQFLDNQDSIDSDRLVRLTSVTTAQIAALNSNLEKVRTDIAAATSALAEHRKTNEELQEVKPAFDEEDTKESLMVDADICREQVSGLMAAKAGAEHTLLKISEMQKRTGELQAQIDAAKMDYEKWERLCGYFGDSKGAKFRKIAQSYILANLIRAANSYMKTLSEKYTLAVDPGEFVIMVEDASQGFARRATSTISGGESFLVSLSLALALSDIGHTLAVDILFIDEGFGTLSGEPLVRAIETLRTLHRKSGRKVGIISHVDELKSKVPVQIQVAQESASSKSTITIV